MIKINLLATERKVVKRKVIFPIGQQLTLACSLVLVLAGAFVGWRYWALAKESARLDADIAKAQQETVRLQAIISQVQQFEKRKAQLQERVTLIEQLRNDQKGPVHMLDQISRSLPPTLWLTDLKQGANASEVVIDGRCTSQASVSDFVANLESTGYFKKSVDIVSSTTEPLKQPPGELVRFSLKAQFQRPDTGKASAPAAAGARQGRGD